MSTRFLVVVTENGLKAAACLYAPTFYLFIYLFICILIFIYIGSRVVSDVLFVLGVQELDSVMYRSFLRFFSHIDYYIVFSRVPSEEAMASHSSTLAWKIPWMEEPGRLQSMGSLRVGHH